MTTTDQQPVTSRRHPYAPGVMTFVEITEDPLTGTSPSAHQRARDTIEQARLADQVGLDLFAVGEHHRTDFVGSAPTIMLAAAAEATEQIRLSSAVTVLSSDDQIGRASCRGRVKIWGGGRGMRDRTSIK